MVRHGGCNDKSVRRITMQFGISSRQQSYAPINDDFPNTCLQQSARQIFVATGNSMRPRWTSMATSQKLIALTATVFVRHIFSIRLRD